MHAQPLPRDPSRFLRLHPEPVEVLREPADGRFEFLSSVEMVAQAGKPRRGDEVGFGA